MSETVFTLITTYSVYVIFASAFLSCLLLPLPTSLMMLAGGAFVASGDLVLWQVIVAAHGGAIIGDQIGYLIGRHGGAPLLEKVARSPTRAVPPEARASPCRSLWRIRRVFLEVAHRTARALG